MVVVAAQSKTRRSAAALQRHRRVGPIRCGNLPRRTHLPDFSRAPGLSPNREPNQSFDVTTRQSRFDGKSRTQMLTEAEFATASPQMNEKTAKCSGAHEWLAEKDRRQLGVLAAVKRGCGTRARALVPLSGRSYSV